MSAAAVIIYRQRQFVIGFLEAGATSPATACSLDHLGLRTHWVFRRMAREGVFLAVSPDRWYLDTAGWHRFEERQRRRIVRFIGVSAVTLILVLLIILLN